jgi:hypothetical protein
VILHHVEPALPFLHAGVRRQAKFALDDLPEGVGELLVGVNDTTLRLSIDDDGGGADPALRSGIIGLIERVDTMGGKLTLRSPLGEGTWPPGFSVEPLAEK